MRNQRVRFEDVNLLSYYEFLTPFIFSKIHLEFDKLELVHFISCDQNTGITSSGRAVTSSKCSCEFHLSMNLPCRHIMRFRKQIGMDIFAPELCAVRWTARYYNESHPALQMNEHNPVTVPIYIQKVRVPEEKDKYKAAASITKEINTLVSTMTTPEYNFYMEKLKGLKAQIVTPVAENRDTNDSRLSFQGVVNSTAATTSTINAQIERTDATLDAMDLSIPKTGSTPSSSIGERLENELQPILSNFELNGNYTQQSKSPPAVVVNGPLGSSEFRTEPYDSRLIIVSPTSKEIQQINLPYKPVSVGRPKGSKINTVIGTKRKKAIQKLKTISAVASSEKIIQPKRSERIRKSKEINSGLPQKRAKTTRRVVS